MAIAGVWGAGSTVKQVCAAGTRPTVGGDLGRPSLRRECLVMTTFPEVAENVRAQATGGVAVADHGLQHAAAARAHPLGLLGREPLVGRFLLDEETARGDVAVAPQK